MMRYILVRTLLVGLLATAAQAQQPVPALTGRVVDEADVLSSSAEQTLTALLKAHEDSTSNQMAVLTVPSLGGEAVEAYTLRVAEAWELGQADRDNGVLLLVAVADRELRIEVGYGLEGVLPDVVASRIIRHEIVPHFREGDFERGIEAGVLALVERLDAAAAPEPVAAEQEPSPPPTPDVDVPPPSARPAFDPYLMVGELGGWVFFVAVLYLAALAAALAALDPSSGRLVVAMLLAPVFFLAGRAVLLNLPVFWYVGWHGAGLLALGAYGLGFWAITHRLKHDAAFRTAWERAFTFYAHDDEEPAKKRSRVVPEVLRTGAVLAFGVDVGLYLYLRWFSPWWLAGVLLMLLFVVSRMNKKPTMRRVASGGGSTSSSRSWFSTSRSRSSSNSWSSSSSWGSSSSSFSSSGSSFGGGGGSFGGGGASGSW